MAGGGVENEEMEESEKGENNDDDADKLETKKSRSDPLYFREWSNFYFLCFDYCHQHRIKRDILRAQCEKEGFG